MSSPSLTRGSLILGILEFPASLRGSKATEAISRNSRLLSPFWFLPKEIFYLYLLQIPENSAIIRFKKAQNEQKRKLKQRYKQYKQSNPLAFSFYFWH